MRNINNEFRPPAWLLILSHMAVGIIAVMLILLTIGGPIWLAETNDNALYLLLWVIPVGAAAGLSMYDDIDW